MLRSKVRLNRVLVDCGKASAGVAVSLGVLGKYSTEGENNGEFEGDLDGVAECATEVLATGAMLKTVLESETTPTPPKPRTGSEVTRPHSYVPEWTPTSTELSVSVEFTTAVVEVPSDNAQCDETSHMRVALLATAAAAPSIECDKASDSNIFDGDRVL